MRGAWIEIRDCPYGKDNAHKSLPMRGRGLKYRFQLQFNVRIQSLPLRGAWIENKWMLIDKYNGQWNEKKQRPQGGALFCDFFYLFLQRRI